MNWVVVDQDREIVSGTRAGSKAAAQDVAVAKLNKRFDTVLTWDAWSKQGYKTCKWKSVRRERVTT